MCLCRRSEIISKIFAFRPALSASGLTITTKSIQTGPADTASQSLIALEIRVFFSSINTCRAGFSRLWVEFLLAGNSKLFAHQLLHIHIISYLLYCDRSRHSRHSLSLPIDHCSIDVADSISPPSTFDIETTFLTRSSVQPYNVGSCFNTSVDVIVI